MNAQGISGELHDFYVFNSLNQIWNGTNFVNWNDANFATYRVSATEQGTSGRFIATDILGGRSFELRLRGDTLLRSPAVDGGVINTGGNSGVDGFTDIDRDKVDFIYHKLVALPGDRPAIVLPAPEVPYEHLIPVLFHPGHFGVTNSKVQVQFHFLDDKPIYLEGINEMPLPVSPAKNTTDFPVYAGCFLWESSYLVSEGATGIYYAVCNECKLTKVNAKFRVPPLPAGKTHYFLAELLKVGIT